MPAPQLVGLPLDEAQDLAAQQQLVVSIGGYEVNESVEPDTVLSQDPIATTPISAGSTVTVVLSQSSTTVAVPELRGQTEAALVQALIEAELQVGTRLEPAYDPEDRGWPRPPHRPACRSRGGQKHDRRLRPFARPRADAKPES